MSTKPTADNDVRQSEAGTSPKKPSQKVKAVYAQIQEFFPLMKEFLHQGLLAGIEDQHKWTRGETVNLFYKVDFLMDLVAAVRGAGR